jgi:putative RNA 2'-phosphotransferase
MLSEKETIRISKFLSLVLRHKPEIIGLMLDEQGWTPVAELLQKLKAKGFHINHDQLQHVVETNNKRRFAFSDDGTKIRASQGHSVNVDLDYAEMVPPAILYHGTAEKNMAAILKEGLHKQKRHHVHLSANKETAIQVGQRHGKPVVLSVMAEKMHAGGYKFYRSANGVWLTDEVPARYLELY